MDKRTTHTVTELSYFGLSFWFTKTHQRQVEKNTEVKRQVMLIKLRSRRRKEEQASESHSSQTENLQCENFHCNTTERC